jgi:hypothetical protein
MGQTVVYVKCILPTSLVYVYCIAKREGDVFAFTKHFDSLSTFAYRQIITKPSRGVYHMLCGQDFAITINCYSCPHLNQGLLIPGAL